MPRRTSLVALSSALLAVAAWTLAAPASAASTGCRAPTAREAHVLSVLAKAACLQHAGPGTSRCMKSRKALVSRTDARFALAGRLGEGYSGTVFKRTGARTLDFRAAVTLGGGSIPCVATHGVPAQVLRDLQACFPPRVSPSGVAAIAGTWSTHAGSLTVSSQGVVSMTYPREDPRTYQNNFPQVRLTLTTAVPLGASGPVSSSEDPQVSYRSIVTITRTTIGARAAMQGGFTIDFCDASHARAGACGA